jgi:beta-glucosidase
MMIPVRAALVVSLSVVLSEPALAQATDSLTLPFRNPALSFEARAKDIVSRLTLEEKAEQMKDKAPAIPRLGIPEYNWWNEALHGVARAGLATSFPQAIGLAATWDDSLMFRIATVISDEARAKYHEALRHDDHARYHGLTFWSPNINLFRDPRWGRGQETYGEDPFLTGRLAVQFIRGLQGNDAKYYKTVATVKHFAVHSGPEPERHTFDAVVSERDLRESYLPHFEMGIREGHAYSLMCAYNRVDGKPACGSDMLLKDILRGEWKFAGYVVSDCGAIDDMYLRHKVVPTAPEAAALGVKTGTDLDCGRVYPNLVQAVRQGVISEAEVDTSLYRLFLARMKLGMFDPSTMVPWTQTPYAVVDQPSHRVLARDAARESIVLLKNANHALPLPKTLKTIAVIGPNSDEPRMLLGNYNGEPADPVTPLRGIREALPNTRVLYARGSDLAEGVPGSEQTPGGGTVSSRDSLEAEAIRTATQADAVVMFLGLTPRLEGEEMRLQVPGFRGGDRTSVDLPAPQQRLLERVASTVRGKPTVLVLMSGSAVAINWAQEHVPAIVAAWYPGQAAGSAIADVLFGDYNPAGRLPVTFYRSTSDLPPFEDYKMDGRTYRFFKGSPLYPFGHGLSYTTFLYSNLRTNKPALRAGDSVIVQVDVKNTGARAGDEVVQLYVQHVGSKVPRANKDLRGYRRVSLTSGATKTVTFTLPATAIAYWDSASRGWVVEADHLRLLIGASSADIRATKLIPVGSHK